MRDAGRIAHYQICLAEQVLKKIVDYTLATIPHLIKASNDLWSRSAAMNTARSGHGMTVYNGG